MTLKLDDLKNNNTKNIDVLEDNNFINNSMITQLNDYTCTVYVRQNKYGHVLKT